MTQDAGGERFARLAFKFAGIYGIVVLAPLYFMEDLINTHFPPAITHPDHFYGVIGLALAWQVAFLVIATDPPRYRPLMPVTLIEKFSFSLAVVVLFAKGRVPLPVLGPALLDMAFGVLFFVAWRRTPITSRGS
jgi:hypothetical protein